MMSLRKVSFRLVVGLLFSAQTAWGAALGTGFTYQGLVTDGGVLVPPGTLEMRFRLYNDELVGTPLGEIIFDGVVPPNEPLVNVDDGRFQVELDYGVAVFDGTQLWLELEIEAVTQAPRQKITVTPYALQTRGMFVDTAGNVGIGTNTPTSELDLGSGSLWVGGTDAGALPAISGAGIRIFNDSSSSHIFAFDYATFSPRDLRLQQPGGNVGIGPSTPSSLLHLSSLVGIDLLIEADTNNVGETQNARMVLSQDGGIVVGRLGYRDGQNKLEIMNEFNDSLILGTNNADRLTIRNTGNVGIGTGSPAARLQVVGGTEVTPTGGGQAVFGSTSTSIGFFVNNIAIGDDEIMARQIDPFGVRSAAILFLNRDGGDVMISPDGTGNVGIGINSSVGKLRVHAPGPAQGDILLSGDGNNLTYGLWDGSSQVRQLKLDGGDNGSLKLVNSETDIVFEAGGLFPNPIERMRIKGDSGSVGIGTGTPDPLAKLHVFATDPSLSAAVFAEGYTVGVRGESNWEGGGRGVRGVSRSTTAFANGVEGITNSPDGFGVFSFGDLGATGLKPFIQPHPSDPSKVIFFVALEGNEAGTYFRGSTRLTNGRVVIAVPEEFRLVSEADGMTAQVTPTGPNGGLWVESKSLERIVVRGNGDAKFDYFVNGFRRGYGNLELIRENHAYIPEVRGVPFGTQYPEAYRQILVQNGILNPDFTPNEQTADRRAWKLRDPETDRHLAGGAGDGTDGGAR